MRHFNKVIVILLALALLLSVAACQKEDDSQATKPSETKATQDKTTDTKTEDEPAGMFDEFVTITNYCMGNPPVYQEPVEAAWNEILMDRGLNAEMKLMWIEWSDWKVKYNLTVSSGDPSIDLIHSSSTWLELWENSKKGAFLALDDLLPTYMPETWASVTPEEWDQCRFDGKIVAVPENNYTQYVNHGMFYRGDWAAEFGITEPITTFEELEVYYQGIMDNKENVVPWDVGSNGSLYVGYINTYTPMIQTNVATGRHRLFYGQSADDPYTLVSPVFAPEFVEYAKLMDKWAKAGYWREDVLNYDGDAREGMKAGTSGSDQHHVNTYRGLKPDLEDHQPGADMQMFMWNDGPSQNLVAEPITHGATSVVSGSQNPERALAILELIRTDQEFYETFVFGIKGTNWDVDDEGYKKEPDGYDKATTEYYSDWWGGRMDEFELKSRDEWPGIYDMWADLDTKVQPFPYGNFVIDRTNIEAELTALGQVTETYGPAIDFGKTPDVEAAIEDYRNALKAAGYDKVLAELQAQMDAYGN